MKRLLAASTLLVLMVGLSVSPSEAILNVQVIETGQISLSADGAGAADGTSTIQVDKPNLSATVRSAYLTCAITRRSPIGDGDITLGGTGVNWDLTVVNDFSNNAFGNVTGIVKPTVDAAPAGLVDFALVETVNAGAIEGCGLYVIFDDPLEGINTAILLYGGQDPAGDEFAVTLAEPLEASDAAQMGLAISFGYQGIIDPPTLCGPTGRQASEVDINGQRVSSCAGNYDDKEADEGARNGNLITVGGLGDDPANPTDPLQRPGDGATPRIVEDELYNLVDFLGPSDTQVLVETINPSGDDNIFAGHMFLTPAAIVGEGITLGPTFAVNPVDTEHTVTATVVDDAGAPVPGIEVFFEVTAGPNAGDSGSTITDADGVASFTYLGDGGPGTDTIVASFFNDSQDQIFSNEAFKEWTAGDVTPPECYLLSIDPGPPIAIQIFTQDTGSGLDTIDVLAADNAVVTIPSFTVGTTDPVIVEAGKADESLPATILLRVTDVDGNATECDPVLARIQIPKNRQRVVERFPGVPNFERFVTIRNAHNGVRMVAIAVNGRMAFFQRLSTNQEITRVIGPEKMAEGAGKNNVAIWAFGRPGSKVTVLISDGVGTEERLIVLPDKRRPGASRWYSGRDMTWGKRPR